MREYGWGGILVASFPSLMHAGGWFYCATHHSDTSSRLLFFCWFHFSNGLSYCWCASVGFLCCCWDLEKFHCAYNFSSPLSIMVLKVRPGAYCYFTICCYKVSCSTTTRNPVGTLFLKILCPFFSWRVNRYWNEKKLFPWSGRWGRLQCMPLWSSFSFCFLHFFFIFFFRSLFLLRTQGVTWA